MKKQALVFIVVVLSVPLAIQAQQQPDRKAPVGGTFMRLDVNGDGKVDQAEAQADPQAVGRFHEFDLNQDGFVTPEEIQQYDEAAKKGRIDRANKKAADKKAAEEKAATENK